MAPPNNNNNHNLISALMAMGQQQPSPLLSPEEAQALEQVKSQALQVAPPAPQQVGPSQKISLFTKRSIGSPPSVRYGDEVDNAFYAQTKNRQNMIDELQKQFGEVKAQPTTFADVNLKPALAYADMLTGANTVDSYTAPTGLKDRQALAQKLSERIMQQQGQLGDDQLAYLKQKAADRRSDMMLAKMDQAAKSAGWDATDRDFAKTYEDWNAQGGYSTADRAVKGIEDAISKLEANNKLTGFMQQVLPDFARKNVSPESIALQQQVEHAVMGSLRATLGPQFTENEGKRILNLAYDPALPSKYNLDKLRALAKEQRAKVEAKNAASNYFKTSGGTLRGFDPARVVAPSIDGANEIKEWNGKKYALQGDNWVEVK